MGDDVGNSFCNVYVHYVFCTKNREPWIIPDIQDRLWSYMGGIARSHGMKALCIGGYFDHVHALLSLPVTMSICVAIKLIKGGSAKWLNENYAVKGSFSWQEGYAAYSVGRSEAKRIRAYIKRQNEHHSKANIK
jgi:REP element-mobilizing transposase RayT